MNILDEMLDALDVSDDMFVGAVDAIIIYHNDILSADSCHIYQRDKWYKINSVLCIVSNDIQLPGEFLP